jgi:hypothetical protein
MLIVVALFVWFAVSVPATLIIGRILGAGPHGNRVPSPEPARVLAYRHGFVRS